ncbi:hypothetical protein N9480_00325, partial [Planktomarina temperata]|nr:hypothetical protein [Planktomarina temperata]
HRFRLRKQSDASSHSSDSTPGLSWSKTVLLGPWSVDQPQGYCAQSLPLSHSNAGSGPRSMGHASQTSVLYY